MKLKTILIVDDDIYIGDMIEEVLSGEGYAAARAYSGTEALMYLSSNRPDLILLDLMLPGLSGEELLPLIKGIPVIVVSAKAEVSDKVELLLAGASDYITKPISTEELLARITVQLRKSSAGTAGDLLTFDSICLNLNTRAVEISGVPVHLTQTEYAILKTPYAEPVPGHHQIRDAGPHQRGYAGLHGEFPESTHQQPAQETEKCRGERLYRSSMGNRV